MPLREGTVVKPLRAGRVQGSSDIEAGLMMQEILGVTDEPGVHRRWFHDDYFDLFVWQSGAGELVQFQLCYGIDSSEQALVWHKESGFYLDGTKASGSAKAPFAARFDAAARALPEEIRVAMTARVREFVENKDATPARRKRFRRASWQQT
jgi:hypothetical protein